MTTNFLKTACDIIKEAVQKDNEDDYENAISLYAQGIQYLITGLKYEKNQKVEAAIKEKVQKYLNRVEQIKSSLPPDTTKTKRKKKKVHKYPTQQEINQASNDVNEEIIYLIHGYTRSIETLLDITYCIPEDIVKLCLLYYHTTTAVENSIDPKQQIVSEKPNVKWDDVAGLNSAKQKLKELVILPLKFPTLFTSKNRNKRCNILLYGPAGTGKSLLSKAIATETNNATFFSLSSCDLCSRYYSEPDKLIRNAFVMARNKQPSIICFDEIDCLCPTPTRLDENPSRIMTEFLSQLQGLSESERQIVVIGITNCPWQLSCLARRLFATRIYVALPDQEARECMFRIHIGNNLNNLSQQNYVTLAQRTQGFSGSDISCIVQDALMEPVRRVQNATHFKRIVNQHDASEYKLVPCNVDDDGAIQMSLLDIPVSEQDHVRAEPLEMKHFVRVLQDCRPSVSTTDIQMYINWRNEFRDEE